mmetsp:Transcript_17626/g.28985  ORF Transcript_17626/g.28985 Transcript_17626/m.28985 type:complete len:593 (-) Transcript_17626:942-2720(-)
MDIIKDVRHCLWRGLVRISRLYCNNSNNSSSSGGSDRKDISCSPTKKKKMDHPTHENHDHYEDDTNQKGAIYITVGPQCSGKTTLLKSLFGKIEMQEVDSPSSTYSNDQQQESTGLDITIDDQALVYLSLPTPIYFTGPCIYDSTPGMKERCDALLDVVVLGRSITNRLSDKEMDELLWVMQRLAGDIDAEYFAKRIRDDNNTPRPTLDDLIDAVEYVIATKHDEGITNLLPETVDLFIVESIFRPRPLSQISRFAGNEYNRLRELSKRTNNTNATEAPSALEDAQTSIRSFASDSKQYPPTAALSWGNTNTRPREMITALEAAEKSQRPVHFIIFGGLEACDKIRNHTFQVDADLTLCLPHSSRLTLSKRNICRFVETGRYIPCKAISDAMERVDSMVTTAVAEANKEENLSSSSSSCVRNNDAKFRLDYELAKLAGYHLHENRTVSCLSPPVNRGNYSTGGRGNAGGRGRYTNGGRSNSNRGRGQNSNNSQDYQRRRVGGGGRGGGRNYTEGSSGRSYNQGSGGSYNSQGRGRGGSSHHQGGRQHSNQQGYRGQNSKQYSEGTRGNSNECQRSGSGGHYNDSGHGRGRGR